MWDKEAVRCGLAGHRWIQKRERVRPALLMCEISTYVLTIVRLDHATTSSQESSRRPWHPQAVQQDAQSCQNLSTRASSSSARRANPSNAFPTHSCCSSRMVARLKPQNSWRSLIFLGPCFCTIPVDSCCWSKGTARALDHDSQGGPASIATMNPWQIAPSQKSHVSALVASLRYDGWRCPAKWHLKQNHAAALLMHRGRTGRRLFYAFLR